MLVLKLISHPTVTPHDRHDRLGSCAALALHILWQLKAAPAAGAGSAAVLMLELIALADQFAFAKLVTLLNCTSVE